MTNKDANRMREARVYASETRPHGPDFRTAKTTFTLSGFASREFHARRRSEHSTRCFLSHTRLVAHRAVDDPVEPRLSDKRYL